MLEVLTHQLRKAAQDALALPRSVRRQRPSSKAVRAALTAASTSACPQRATLAITRPSIGVRLSKVSPLRAPTSSPLISARPSGRSGALSRSQSLRLRVLGTAFTVADSRGGGDSGRKMVNDRVSRLNCPLVADV
jgi:hypothetical protein